MTKISLLLSAAIVLAGCATSKPAPAPAPAPGSDTDMATRINRICALPEPEREQQIAKLKKDSGLVLYCGDRR
jgi:hypothetical protein